LSLGERNRHHIVRETEYAQNSITSADNRHAEHIEYEICEQYSRRFLA